MENELRDNPASYTKTLWAFACLGGAVPMWLLTLRSTLSNLSFDNLFTVLIDLLGGFYFSVLAVPAALATALWAKRRNWRRNLAGCLKTVCAGGVCGGAYPVLLMVFLSALNSSGFWNRDDWGWAGFFAVVFAVCGMVSAAVLSVLFLPKPD
ncbi:hypothetical protein [Conchiformibius kuhniae]|uniref:Uncharacterized protein n=1 Tax=Conchiformibius kuhniae TaxID=211502 RepID=A0A8T9MW69_9NEIS|nr:hypothetical protein [Conchiformibius kuhniae]UOP05085.1 hypothetical protein LVJ77_01965 [Conchiformibius kuhniae]